MFLRVLAAYLLVTLALCVVMGALLYLDPALTASLWPYPVKSLAARMFASMFLALAVAQAGALVVGLRDSAKGVLVTTTPIFGMLLVAALLSSGSVLSAGVRAVGWLTVFALVVGTGGVLILWSRGAGRDETESVTSVPRGLRRALIVHTLVVVFFGLNMLAAPALALNFWPWKVSGIVMQGLGGFFVGSAVGTGWAASQRRYERIRAVLPSYFSFTGLVLVAVVLDADVIARESPGLHVTAIWLAIYFYVTIYSAYYFVRLGGFRERAGNKE